MFCALRLRFLLLFLVLCWDFLLVVSRDLWFPVEVFIWLFKQSQIRSAFDSSWYFYLLIFPSYYDTLGFCFCCILDICHCIIRLWILFKHFSDPLVRCSLRASGVCVFNLLLGSLWHHPHKRGALPLSSWDQWDKIQLLSGKKRWVWSCNWITKWYRLANRNVLSWTSLILLDFFHLWNMIVIQLHWNP